MMQLFSTSAKLLQEKYKDSRLIYDLVGETAESISEHLFPNENSVSIYQALWL